jgi:hypothetical protein
MHTKSENDCGCQVKLAEEGKAEGGTRGKHI